MKRENTDSVGRRAVFSFFFFVSSQPGWSVSLCKCTVFSVEDGERLDTLICIAIIPREKKKKGTYYSNVPLWSGCSAKVQADRSK